MHDSPILPLRVRFPRLALPTLCFAALFCGAAFAQSTAIAPIHLNSQVAENYGKLPLSFEANQGQTGKEVKFFSRGDGYSLFLTGKSAVLALTKADKTQQPASSPARTDVVGMELAGANPSAQVTGADKLPGIANYFPSSDQNTWHTNIPTYAKVKYASVYPGVDLIYYGNQRQLEYDFVVAPNASAEPIQLHFAGAKKLKLTPEGDLTVIARNGEIAFTSLSSTRCKMASVSPSKPASNSRPAIVSASRWAIMTTRENSSSTLSLSIPPISAAKAPIRSTPSLSTPAEMPTLPATPVQLLDLHIPSSSRQPPSLTSQRRTQNAAAPRLRPLSPNSTPLERHSSTRPSLEPATIMAGPLRSTRRAMPI